MAGGRSRNSAASAKAEVISSRDNRWLKEFRVALRGGVPTASGAVGVEGVRLVEEALKSGCRVEAVLFGESGERHRERLAPLIGRAEMGFPALRTTDRLFEGVADTEHPQGVAALVVPRTWTLEEVIEGTGGWRGTSRETSSEIPRYTRNDKFPGEVCAPLIVVLAGVQDPGNVGTILRTAAAFGATAAVTAATGQSGTASAYAPKALRASAGAALHLPIVSGMALAILLTQCKLRGIRTLASSVHEEQWRVAFQLRSGQASGECQENDQERKIPGANAAPGAPGRENPHFAESVRNDVVGAETQRRKGAPSLAPWEIDWCEAVALLVGNEGAGLSEDVVYGADAQIHIPMASGVESLNAAAAAAVVLYEAFRQRKQAAGAR